MTDPQREEDDMWRAIHHHSRLGQDDAKRLAPILLGHMRQLGYTIEHPTDPIGTAQELIEQVAQVIQREAIDRGADSPVDYGDAEQLARAVLDALQSRIAEVGRLTKLLEERNG